MWLRFNDSYGNPSLISLGVNVRISIYGEGAGLRIVADFQSGDDLSLTNEVLTQEQAVGLVEMLWSAIVAGASYFNISTALRALEEPNQSSTK